MATRLQSSDDNEVEQILLRAIRSREATDSNLRDNLLASADELGIPRAEVLRAEREHHAELAQKQELAEYHADQRKGFRQHLLIFGIVNLCMAGINAMTWAEDHTLWVMYLILSWGIGLAIHASVALARRGADSAEFKIWRRMHGKDETEPTSSPA